jgi:hypothetical protein
MQYSTLLHNMLTLRHLGGYEIYLDVNASFPKYAQQEKT